MAQPVEHHYSAATSQNQPTSSLVQNNNSQNLNDEEIRKKRRNRNKQIGRLRNIAENISLSIDQKNVESIKKIKKILGCTDEQLEEFRNFQQNEAKLLKMFGNFIDLGPQNDLLKTFLHHRKSQDKYTPELTDKFSVIDVVAQAAQKDDEKNLTNQSSQSQPGKHKESNIKIKKLLGISDAHLDAYRNYQQHYKKLEKILGTFIQLDDVRGLKKIDQLEHHFGIVYDEESHFDKEDFARLDDNVAISGGGADGNIEKLENQGKDTEQCENQAKDEIKQNLEEEQTN